MLKNSIYHIKSINMNQCRLLKEKLLKLYSGLKVKVVGDPHCPLIIIPTILLSETPTANIIILK